MRENISLTKRALPGPSPSCTLTAPARREEDQGDVSVHVEEGDVETGQVVRRDERVLVDEQRGHRHHAEPEEPAEAGHESQGDKGGNGEEVAEPRALERGGDAEAGREGVEARAAVEVDILAGVDQIEAGDPYGEGEPQHEGRRLEGAAHGDPAAGGGDAVGEAEDPVRGPGETLGVGVANEEKRGPRRELEAQRVQYPRGDPQEH